MDRFPTRQVFDRSRGAAVGAPGDGIAQGAPYVAVLQSEPAGGLVDVTIPTLHLSVTYRAFIQPGAGGTKGETATVIFDQDKIPHVIRGSWEPPGIARGTVLPASPVDGQEYDYVADATNGIIWRFRYRSASTSTHKWEFVGGAPLYSYTTGAAKLVSANTWTSLGNSPSVTLPLAGDYEFMATTVIRESAAIYGTVSMGIGFGGTPTLDQAITGGTFPNSANGFQNLSIQTVVTERAAGQVAALYFEVNETETLTSSKEHILVRPVRVG